jgi:hypothetical protein
MRETRNAHTNLWENQVTKLLERINNETDLGETGCENERWMKLLLNLQTV